jgi:hypothetical protein
MYRAYIQNNSLTGKFWFVGTLPLSLAFVSKKDGMSLDTAYRVSQVKSRTFDSAEEAWNEAEKFGILKPLVVESV